VSGTNLYVGGVFSGTGKGGVADGVAQWNGNTWSLLGTGIDGGVRALAMVGTNLYAGGQFRIGAGANIAEWNGSSWLPLGAGINGNGVFALAVSGANLYVAGDFTAAGGLLISDIAQWNGSSWSAVGSSYTAEQPLPFRPVQSLAVVGGYLYAGGLFTSVGGNINASYIARWNGANWSALTGGTGSGLNGEVNAVLVSGNSLYLGGRFSQAGGVAANCVVQWDGSNWSPLGSGFPASGPDGPGPYVSALAVSSNLLYVGGDFWLGGGFGVVANGIAAWNGTNWSALGEGISGSSTEGNEEGI
jgi:trimeric autotransporter adhesin